MKRTTENSSNLDPAIKAKQKFVWLLAGSIFIAGMTFFILVLFLYPSFLGWATGDQVKPLDTSALEGFTSLLTLSVVAGGVVFWVIDRLQKDAAEAAQNRSLSYQLFETIHDRLVNPEQEEARRWIITNIPIKLPAQPLEEWFTQVTEIIEAKPKKWTQDRSPGQIHIKQVLNNLDFIGFVSDHFWDARDSDIEWISPPVSKVWLRLGPYVQHLSVLRNEPDYYRSAAAFGEFCIRWRVENNLTEANYVAGI